ncbi:4-hydroxy-3-methylbut-2-enyl diphosphate reductase [Candidatus Cyanaurora vandensis]|uniref:4-hydroxy-3-methylbut-2-enyl diphosphate reductase n=1 Tax=Candidatus Cyanaurora vandensis TaxID=2714958 RepID=UPI00257C27B0|nr:4-hydroxy-3-methylbut-2-enyl diphosphate reductase [Candidatus Cyanaurora vandensis]
MSDTYNRKGFGLKAEVKPQLQAAYDSGLIAQIRAQGYTYEQNGIVIRLAEAFGFCWGVDRAVSMAYETRKHFPDHRIWITNEIIHNPQVNRHLTAMGIAFLDGPQGEKDFSPVAAGDVVILPAFGASISEMERLRAKGCTIVDTTCPWVSRVWTRVAKYEKHDFTAIIHGKYNHEETVATASRANCYLIVLNLAEAQWVCDYILHGGDPSEFRQKFPQAAAPDFDPDRHLIRVGVANQTTMLKGETERIGKLFEQTMLQKYGPAALEEHFSSPGDTICDATQERQDAMLQLVEEPLDRMVVIGGFNSSNTTHLQEIAIERGLVSYHIDGPDCLDINNTLYHKPLGQTERVRVSPWLPNPPLRIGVTAGASTPDRVVSQVIEKILQTAEQII